MKCYYLFKPWLHTAPQGTSGKWKAGIKKFNGFTFNVSSLRYRPHFVGFSKQWKWSSDASPELGSPSQTAQV